MAAPPASAVLRAYRVLRLLPGGRRAFSTAYAWQAPYFRSVRPRVLRLGPHRAEVLVPDRRSVRNHLGGVHAIAVCNGLEAAMGALATVTVPRSHRWVPKGMTVDYLARADSDVRCVAETTAADWDGGPDVPVSVHAVRVDGTVVVRGVIRLWVTERSGE
jgi:acyl-coenzyme A thioesterase PaaI-like protein